MTTPGQRWLLIVMLACVARGAVAQGPGVEVKIPPLEVISVRQNAGDGHDGSVGIRDDGIYAHDVPLRFLMNVAFQPQQLANGHIVGLPGWSETQCFEVLGKTGPNTTVDTKSLNREQRNELRSTWMRAVLTERFHMQTHLEERETPVYALVIAKGGPKIHPSAANPPRDFVAPNGEHVQLGTMAIPGKLGGHAVPIGALVAMLQSAGQLDRPVVDRTGLTGNYDLYVAWSPEHGDPLHDDASPNADLPSLFTALQEQMGLKLEPAKAPIKTLIVDHVEKPSEN